MAKKITPPKKKPNLKGKIESFEDFMDTVPAEDLSLVDQLNNLLKDHDMYEFVDNNFPDTFGEVEEVFNGTQYEDDSNVGTIVWFFKKYNTYIKTTYYSDSYNGDDCSDSVFEEVRPVQKTITIYETLPKPPKKSKRRGK